VEVTETTVVLVLWSAEARRNRAERIQRMWVGRSILAGLLEFLGIGLPGLGK
jgi:hypothetical protein